MALQYLCRLLQLLALLLDAKWLIDADDIKKVVFEFFENLCVLKS